MGVFGLETFAENHNLLRDSTLEQGTEVVIDGSALLRFLNYELPRGSIRFGGEYETFAKVCDHFLNTFVVIGIKVCIVFEGGLSLQKVAKMKEKHSSRLKMFNRIARGEKEWKSHHLLPAFAQKCLLDAIENNNRKVEHNIIKIITASYEADNEVARQARIRNCPVLSTDSDMMIFDLPDGYVPLENLKWKHTNNESFLRCKRVTRSDLSRELKIAEERMPLFAAIVTVADLGKNTKFDDHNPEKAYQLICDRIREEKEAKISEAFCNNFYKGLDWSTVQSNMDSFNSSIATSVPDIPERLTNLLKTGTLYHGALTVWQQGRFIPVRHVEDACRPCCNDVARSIRAIWYSIICAGSSKRRYVLELTRTPTRVSSMEDRVRLKDVLPDGTETGMQVAQLENPGSGQNARNVLIHALDGYDGADTVSAFTPENWRNVPQFELPALVLHFWNKHSDPSDLVRRALIDFVSRQAEDIEESEEVPFDLDIAHAYAQWQSCLIAAADLNVILGKPLRDFDISLLSNGSQLHQIYQRLL